MGANRTSVIDLSSKFSGWGGPEIQLELKLLLIESTDKILSVAESGIYWKS